MKNADSPVFTVGAPRSGKTLTARLTGNHSNIFMPGETRFLNEFPDQERIDQLLANGALASALAL